MNGEATYGPNHWHNLPAMDVLSRLGAAPALASADVGVAMGSTGTGKGAASLVLWVEEIRKLSARRRASLEAMA